MSYYESIKVGLIKSKAPGARALLVGFLYAQTFPKWILTGVIRPVFDYKVPTFWLAMDKESG